METKESQYTENRRLNREEFQHTVTFSKSPWCHGKKAVKSRDSTSVGPTSSHFHLIQSHRTKPRGAHRPANLAITSPTSSPTSPHSHSSPSLVVTISVLKHPEL